MNQLQNGDSFPDVSGTSVNHATNFLLRDGVVQATYSSGPIGRMQAEHVAGVVEFYQDQED